MKESGKVKWFNDAKGFGFITRESGQDVFVHSSALQGETFRILANDQNIGVGLAAGPRLPIVTRYLPSPEYVPKEDPFCISDSDRLAAQNKMLFSLIGEENIKAQLKALFPYKIKRERFNLIFEHKETVTISDYAIFLNSIDRIYKLLLTFIKKEYFITRWFRGNSPYFMESDLIQVEKIVKQSPGQIQGTAIGAVAQALQHVFSIGKQIEDFRMADVRVQAAKVELDKKKKELEAQERKEAIQNELGGLDLEYESLKKQYEIEKLKTQINEEKKKRDKIFMEDIDRLIDLLGKQILVIPAVPKETINDLKVGLYTELEGLLSSNIELKDIKILKTK